jgi:hypothetical protein
MDEQHSSDPLHTADEKINLNNQIQLGVVGKNSTLAI